MKQAHKLFGLALGLSICSVFPAEANPTQDETLISQLRGHVIEDPIEIYKQDWLQFKFEDYVIGRIRGVTGDIAQVELLSPPSINMVYNVGIFTTGERDVYKVTTSLPRYWPTLVPGADVILREVDGEWVIISDDVDGFRVLTHYSLPRWVSRLDLQEVPLVTRTDIDWDRPDVTIPPLEPSAPPPPAPEPEPVPGMW